MWAETMALWVFQLLNTGLTQFLPGSPSNLTVPIFPSLIFTLSPELEGQSNN